MPSTLALILCTFVVFLLLVSERKQSFELSGVLWVPSIYMIYIAGKPLAFWFRSLGGSSDESPLDQYFLLALLLLGFCLLLKRRFNWFHAINENISIFLLLGFMLLSVLWSDIPFISFKRWIRALVTVVMVFVVLSEANSRKAIEVLFRRVIIICIPFSLLLIKYFPEYGVVYNSWSGAQMWVGVATHKTSLSLFCIFSAFILSWSLIRRCKDRNIHSNNYQTIAEVFILFITIWLLVAGGEGKTSATSIISLAAGISMLVSLRSMRKKGKMIGSNLLIAIISFIIIFGIVTVLLGGASMKVFLPFINRDETLTGRTDIWASVLPIVRNHPFFGVGFGGFWTQSTIEQLQVTELHNGYLEVILELGFIGMLLYWKCILSWCREAILMQSYDFDLACLAICFLLITVLSNVSESSLNTFGNNLMAVLLLLICSAKTAIRRTR